MAPLVTVVTPTWRRHEALLERCVPSVDAQTYPAVEHIIVSDGPDPALARRLVPFIRGSRSRWYLQAPWHDPAEHWGHLARLYALEFASGDLVAYCDDDDSLRPGHCALLAAALLNHPEAGFALSRMATHDVWGHEHEIGEGPPSAGNLGTPMIMHRREILDTATWGPASPTEDWDLINRWASQGVMFVQVDAVTCDAWPSALFSGQHVTTAGKAVIERSRRCVDSQGSEAADAN